MDFELTDEQRWLAESVDEVLGREMPDALWNSLAEFGALDVDTLGAVELVLVARAVGRRLAAIPFVSTAAVRYALGPDAAPDGAIALCAGEPGRTFAPDAPATVLEGDRVTGEKSAVPFGATVDLLAVTAADGAGPALALVRVDDPGVTMTPEALLDRSLEACRFRFDGAAAVRPPTEQPAALLVERIAAAAAVLAAAEAIGAAAAVLELACTYASERRQFGRTIGSFQAIRHLLADLVVLVESSWSSVLYASASLDEHEPEELTTASVAKAWASRATLDVAHGALQVFGGIAFTAEHPAHRFLRRIASLGDQYGTAADHERRLGRSLARKLEVLT